MRTRSWQCTSQGHKVFDEAYLHFPDTPSICSLNARQVFSLSDRHEPATAFRIEHMTHATRSQHSEAEQWNVPQVRIVYCMQTLQHLTQGSYPT